MTTCTVQLVLVLAITLTVASTQAVDLTPTTTPYFSSPSEERSFTTVCPTDGKRAARVNPDDPQHAQIITTNCVVITGVAVTQNDSTLNLSRQQLDLVLSYPDTTTLNFAYNAIDYFPSDAESTGAVRSLILRGNAFKTLSNVEIPPELEYLDVGACKITTIGARTSYPRSLVKLRLGRNQLTSLAGQLFPSSLRALELDDQPIVSLADAAFPSTLEILTAVNISLISLNASEELPSSLVTIDVSSNSLTAFPDFYSFPSITEVNASSNFIRSIAGIQFPWTLKRLDLRGNPLMELEITRSDLKMFQESSYLLPALTQVACRNTVARKVRVQNVDLCVLEDADFKRLYNQPTPTNESETITVETMPPVSSETQKQTDQVAQSVITKNKTLSWTILIVAITTIAMVVIGVISMLSWKHQQLRRKMKNIMDRNTHLRTSSFNGDLLQAVGLQGELVATRYEAEEIKIHHVLGKAGHGLIYLAEMRFIGADGEPIPLDQLPNEEDERMSNALSIQDLERCSSTNGRQLVMLKRMVPEQSNDKSPRLKHFVQEIQLMSQLDHPKIISFLGVYWNSLADVTMVLEYLPNGDLRTLMKIEKDRVAHGQTKRLQWNESQASFASTLSIRTVSLPSKSSIALDIAEALVYIHSFDPPVIHRELRAKHVLFSDLYEAKLSHFGAPCDFHLDITKAASLDSVAWIAPEVLRGEPFTEKADIYAFGILLTELATGTRPFEGLASAAIVLKVTHDNERPSLNDADCPDLVQHFAQLCMSGDPSLRPTALEAQRELLTLRKGIHGKY